MKRVTKVLPAIFLLTLAGVAYGQIDCSPRPSGGYSCYDYNRGTFSDITPRPGGGYSTYDYGTGREGTIRPRPGGGYTIDR
jgi:hypothetical protein